MSLEEKTKAYLSWLETKRVNLSQAIVSKLAETWIENPKAVFVLPGLDKPLCYEDAENQLKMIAQRIRRTKAFLQLGCPQNPRAKVNPINPEFPPTGIVASYAVGRCAQGNDRLYKVRPPNGKRVYAHARVHGGSLVCSQIDSEAARQEMGVLALMYSKYYAKNMEKRGPVDYSQQVFKANKRGSFIFKRCQCMTIDTKLSPLYLAIDEKKISLSFTPDGLLNFQVTPGTKSLAVLSNLRINDRPLSRATIAKIFSLLPASWQDLKAIQR